MTGWARAVVAIAVVFLLHGARAAADGDSGVTPEAVQVAREKAVEWLKKHQGEDGGWGDVEGDSFYGGGGGKKSRGYVHPVGATAWALFALLANGVPKDDPGVRKGFQFVDDRVRASASAYEYSAVILATTARARGPIGWRRSDEVALEGNDRNRLKKCVAWLLEQRAKNKTTGWRYLSGAPPEGGNEDLSSTTLAALALFTADRCGAALPADLWPGLAKYAMAQQDRDGPEHEPAVDENTDLLGPGGTVPAPVPVDPKHRDRARGFAYIRNPKLEPDEGASTGGMTACGVATVQLARLLTGPKTSKTWRAEDQELARRSVMDGCAWLDAHWSPALNPGKTRTNTYHVLYMLHVADAMDLVGSSRLGTRAWYDEMANQLVKTQKETGCWASNSTHNPREVLDTCFALLFFARPFAAPRADAPAPK